MRLGRPVPVTQRNYKSQHATMHRALRERGNSVAVSSGVCSARPSSTVTAPILTGPDYRHETERFPGHNHPGMKHDPQPQCQEHCNHSCSRCQKKGARHSNAQRMRASPQHGPKGRVKVQELRAPRRHTQRIQRRAGRGLFALGGVQGQRRKSWSGRLWAPGRDRPQRKLKFRKLSAEEGGLTPVMSSGQLCALKVSERPR